MKTLLTLAFIFAYTTINFAQETPPLSTAQIEKIAHDLAEEQLTAYNNRNIDNFLKPYSDSVKVYNYPDAFQYTGKEKMRSGYASFFENNPKLHCELVNRTVFGNRVIDQEKVTGFSHNEDFVIYAIAIYTIEDGKISEVRFMSKRD